MLIGKYQHSLDEKGRLIVPAKLRGDLGEVFIISPGLEHCLYAYSLPQWEIVAKQIKELNVASSNRRDFERLFYSESIEAELDKQGRIMIPQRLREHARIEHDVYVIGVSDKVEIWAREIWETYSAQALRSYEEIAKVDVRF